jgi:hypothetical protein
MTITAEQMADLIRAQVMLDRALNKVKGLPLTYPVARRIESLKQTIWGNIGAENDRTVYPAASALYDEWWVDRWKEDEALDAKRAAGQPGDEEGEGR